MPLDRRTHDLVVDCLSFLETHEDQLNDFEKSFLTGKGPNDQYDSLQERYDKYGEEMNLSPKQVAVLERMYDKIINGVNPFQGGR